MYIFHILQVCLTLCMHVHRVHAFSILKTKGAFIIIVSLIRLQHSSPSSVQSCDMQYTVMMYTFWSSCSSWTFTLFMLRPHASTHSSISYSKLLSRLCCFIIDYRADTFWCVSTQHGLVWLQRSAAFVRLAVMKRLSNAARISDCSLQRHTGARAFCGLKPAEVFFPEVPLMCHTPPVSSADKGSLGTAFNCSTL